MIDLLLVCFLIALNALFAMSEVAIISSKKARLQQQADKGSHGAMVALKLQEDPSRFLSSIQIGITSIGILNGIVGEKSLGEPFAAFLMQLGLTQSVAQPLSSGTIIVFLTFLSVVFGELIPKTIGLAKAEKIASLMAIPLNLIAQVFFPLVWFFSKTSKIFLKIIGMGNIEQDPVSNEEVKQLMKEGSDAGIFHKEEGKMVANVLHMDEKNATAIMTHRSEWQVINAQLPFNEMKDAIVKTEFSKILVVDGSVDNILGYVSIKEILHSLCSTEEFDIRKFLEQPLNLPITVTASQVLEEMKRCRRDLAFIINEYGESVGLITKNDIMSAIVGEIMEDDEPVEEDIVDRKDGSYLVDGFIALDKIKSEFGLGEELDKFNGITNLNGFIMGSFGRIPHVGAILSLETMTHKITIEVVDMDKNVVDKVILKIDPITVDSKDDNVTL